MAKKKIDLGETWDAMVPKLAKSQKHYPRLTVPKAMCTASVGKNVTLEVDAKVVGVSQRDEGGKSKSVTELEVRSITPPMSSYAKMRKAGNRANG